MYTHHPISDEQLSAYLDHELSAAELTVVEQALAAQPTVAKRLATLKLVNELAKGQGSVIDAEPLPAALMQLLTGLDTAATPADAPGLSPVSTPVLTPVASLLLHRVRKSQLLAPRALALAASLVLAVGLSFVVLTEFRQQQSGVPTLAAYTNILDTATSGTTVTTDEFELTPRFTFVSRTNSICRLYQLDTAARITDNIACRKGDNWTLHTTVAATAPAAADQYLPAGNTGAQLDAVLDELMLDAPLPLAAETALLNQE